MTQYLPPQKTMPERMASIETLLLQFLREFTAYQEDQKKEHETLKKTLVELDNKISNHVDEDGTTWRKLKWEALKYVFIFVLGSFLTAIGAMVFRVIP